MRGAGSLTRLIGYRLTTLCGLRVRRPARSRERDEEWAPRGGVPPRGGRCAVRARRGVTAPAGRRRPALDRAASHLGRDPRGGETELAVSTK